jgi:DNA-binding beta-propeller fold protein YncE
LIFSTASKALPYKWGTFGTGDEQFRFPGCAAVDSVGNVYVADTGNHRIQMFDSSGTFLTKWGSEGSEDGQFSEPTCVAVDSVGNVYVVDTENHRIQKFGPITFEVDVDIKPGSDPNSIN